MALDPPEQDRLGMSLVGLLIGLALLFVGGFLQSSGDGTPFPFQGLVGVLLSSFGMVLTILPVWGVTRVGGPMARQVARIGSLLMGLLLVVIGIWSFAGSAPNVVSNIQIAVAGFAVCVLVFGDALRASNRASEPAAGVAMGDQMGLTPGSRFCPFDGEPTGFGHRFCQNCGRSIDG